jgi:hypothetical protein
MQQVPSYITDLRMEVGSHSHLRCKDVSSLQRKVETEIVFMLRSHHRQHMCSSLKGQSLKLMTHEYDS